MRLFTWAGSAPAPLLTLVLNACVPLLAAGFLAVGPGAARAANETPPIPTDGPAMESYAKQQLALADAKLKQILAVTGLRTIQNTLVPYNEMSMALDVVGSMTGLMQETHPAEGVRKAAEAAQQEVASFGTKLSLNRDLYEALKAVDVSKSDAKTQYWVTKMLRDYRRAGVDRDEATRKKIEALQDTLVIIGQTFQRNIRDGQRSIELDSAKLLEGLPQDFIDSHQPGADGKIKLTTNYPDYIPFITYAKDTESRRRIYMEYLQRGNPANLTTLPELIRERTALAGVLGYPTWADYITDNKMIETAKNAAEFIDRITTASDAIAEKEYRELLGVKQRTEPKATEVFDYEKYYLSEILKKERYSFDSQSVRPYFDYPKVKDGIMGLTSQLFGVTFKQVTDQPVWNPDVDCYDMFEGSRYIGRFFLDMHPRENKYSHAACFPMRMGVEGVQTPVAALVCNFPGAGNPKPGESLMEHDDVSTFLHEFGHLLHHLFAGRQQWADISGITTEQDFVEAPSQLLEEWSWDTATLQTFAKHWQTGEPIPAALVAQMRKARDFGKGLQVRQQMFYAKLSLSLYDRDPRGLNTTEVVKQIQNKYGKFRYIDGTSMQTSFGHLDGYSAVYYTYMWSLVIAKDLFSKFDQQRMLDPKTAVAYRKAVLDQGGSDKAANLVKNFLGRPFNFDAYTAWLNQN